MSGKLEKVGNQVGGPSDGRRLNKQKSANVVARLAFLHWADLTYLLLHIEELREYRTSASRLFSHSVFNKFIHVISYLRSNYDFPLPLSPSTSELLKFCHSYNSSFHHAVNDYLALR